MKKVKGGFTLIELLVVIAIIGLLSTLSILSLNSARARARDAKRISDVKQIQTALEIYYNDAGQYPATLTVNSPIAFSSSTYMAAIPKPPTPVDGVNCPTLQPEYTYTRVGAGSASSYIINFCLGSAINNIPGNLFLTAIPMGIMLPDMTPVVDPPPISAN